MPKWWCKCATCVLFVGMWILFGGFIALGTAEFEGDARDKKVQAFNDAVDGWDQQDYQSFVDAIGAQSSAGNPIASLPLVTLNVSRDGSEAARADNVAALPQQSDAFDAVKQAEHTDGMKAPSAEKRVYYMLTGVRVLPNSAPPATVALNLPASGGRLQVHHTAEVQLAFPPREDSTQTANSTMSIDALPTVISVATKDPLCSDAKADEQACPQRCDSVGGVALTSTCVQFFRVESICITLSSSTGADSTRNTSRLFGMAGTDAVSPGSARGVTARIGCAQQHALLTRGALRRAGVSSPPSFARLAVPDTDAVAAAAYTPLAVTSAAAAFRENEEYPGVTVAWMADADPFAAAMRATDGTLDFGTPGELIVGAATFLIGLGMVICCCGAGVCSQKYFHARSKLDDYATQAAAQGNTPEQLMAVVRDQDRVMRALPRDQRTDFRVHNGIHKWLEMLRQQTGYAIATPVRTGNPLGTRRHSASVLPQTGVELTETHRHASSPNTKSHKEQATIATMPEGAAAMITVVPGTPSPGVTGGGAAQPSYPMVAPAYSTPQYASTQGSFGAYDNLGLGSSGTQPPMATGPYYPPSSGHGQGGAYGANIMYPSHG